MDHVRPTLTFVLTMVLAGAVGATAAPADVRLSALPETPEGRAVVAGLEGPGALLAAATGVDTLPIACGTPLLAFADQTVPGSPLRLALLAVTSAADGADERVLPTRDGRFLVRVPGPTPGRGPTAGPEYVARVGEALVAARAYLTGTLGYPDPAPGTERVHVHLAGLGHGLEAFVVPGRPGVRGGAAAVVLDAALSADRVMPAVLHQLAHLALPSPARTGIGWSESVAAYLTLLGTGDVEAQRAAMESWLQEPARGLHDDSLARMQGGLLWPLFLAERAGDSDVVRQIAAELATSDLDPDGATDLVLSRDWGLSREAALREMAIWNLRPGERGDGRHDTGAATLPVAALVDLDGSLPLTLDPVEPVAPGGSVAFRLPSEGGRGSLALAIGGEGGRPGADLLAFYAGDHRPALVPVDLSSGRGRAALPMAEAREIWIVLRNDAGAGGGTSRFDLDLRRDPLAPFDLASFTATPMPRSVALEWVTAAESGLVGWNILRSEKPEGPFSRLNSVALPAWGDGGADTGYVFVDDGARPGRRYYYLVEGLTASGLVLRSHVASARIPGR